MGILHSVVFLLLLNAVSAETCYFYQEPNHGGKLRWVMPGSHKERCSCTVIVPGGVNTMTPNRLFKPYYTDHPLFTDNVEMIHDYFNCPDESNPTTTIKTIERADCQAWFDAGNTSNGVYTVSLPSHTYGKDVFCDMEDGKGWLVFQRRQNGHVNFTRPWKEYQGGFGDLTSEFWLGNEALRLLTDVQAGSNWTIRVDLTDEDGQQMSLMTSPFCITGEKYTISIGSSGSSVHGLCRQPLGMEDGTIPESSIKASSVLFYKQTPTDCLATNGRLNHEGGGGWCPKYYDKDTSWFEVDLEIDTQVEGVIVQGSNYGEFYRDWVTKYQVKYSNDQHKWHSVGGTSSSTVQVFNGPTSTDTPVTSMFDEPIQTRYIRIIPTDYENYPSMRIELIGCKGGLIESLNGRQFSTYDNDSDNDYRNCAELSKAGWWFDKCEVESNLNGEYSHRVNDLDKEHRGIRWFAWPERQIVKSKMKMRRSV